MDYPIALTIGLPGQGMHFGLDPLSGLFLCLLAPQVFAVALVTRGRSYSLWLAVLGAILTLAGRDAFALIFGFGLINLAAALAMATHRPPSLTGALPLSSNILLILAAFLPPGSLSFVLVLFAAGAQAGFVLGVARWLRARQPADAGIQALMAGGMIKIGIYIIIRYAFVVMGGVASPWWGGLLIAAGAILALGGAWRSMLETELRPLLDGSTAAHAGLIAVAIGIALRAKTINDPALATLAMQAALFWTAAHALFKPILYLGAAAIEDATGTTSLDWLGGLLRGMPRLSLLMLAAASGIAAIPFGPGFPAEFLTLHAAIAAAGSGGIAVRIGFTVLLAVLGLAAALSLGAAIRLIGIGFLGRPRTLRAAAAEDAPRRVLSAMALLALCATPLALIPGLVATGIQPVIASLIPNAPSIPIGYSPLPIALLMAVLAAAAFLLLRQSGARGQQEAHAWNGGFGKPPAWLPFGNPATQLSATGFAAPLREAFAPFTQFKSAAHGWPELPPAALIWLRHYNRRLSRRPSTRQGLTLVLTILLLVMLTLGLSKTG